MSFRTEEEAFNRTLDTWNPNLHRNVEGLTHIRQTAALFKARIEALLLKPQTTVSLLMTNNQRLCCVMEMAVV